MILKNTPRGFTLVEILIAVGVFSLVSITIISFSRFYYSAVSVTGWKQTASRSLRLNNIFWQDHFVAATHRIRGTIQTDPETGVITSEVEFDEPPLKIRNEGRGSLLPDDYDGERYELWTFEVTKKDEDNQLFEGSRVTAYLFESAPNTQLWVEVTDPQDNPIRNLKLLDNLLSVESMTRRYADENAWGLSINFVLKHPHREGITVNGGFEVRVNTEIQTLSDA